MMQCGSKNRHGIICAMCKNGMSVFYRAQTTFPCKEETHCNFGILFYLISQIIPVTILFLIVILFDIQLTTGALNGFIFYTQIGDSLSLTGNNFIIFPSPIQTLLKILDFIISMFNLKFFNAQPFSFCVFKGATSLDVIAFDYITIVYSLFLILFTILVTNTRCYQVSKVFKKLNRKKLLLSQSIVHGLSGFLIMCYARATTITLNLLTPVWLFGKGPQKIGNKGVLLWRNAILWWQPPEICHSCCVCISSHYYTPPSAVTCISLVLQSAGSHETGGDKSDQSSLESSTSGEIQTFLRLISGSL